MKVEPMTNREAAIIIGAVDMYNALPADAFCSPQQLSAKNKYRLMAEREFEERSVLELYRDAAVLLNGGGG